MNALIRYDVDTKKTTVAPLPFNSTKDGKPTYTGFVYLQLSKYLTLPGYQFDTNEILQQAIGKPAAIFVFSVTDLTMEGFRSIIATPEWEAILKEYLDALAVDIDILFIEAEDAIKGEET